ncbi:MAG: SpoIIE family protein phosphatase [Candidatus Eisenbacteria bacterium]|nr:SpoIIE family protein phosphatase [Candidatus Eisenbacteria bacterium]
MRSSNAAECCMTKDETDGRRGVPTARADAPPAPAGASPEQLRTLLAREQRQNELLNRVGLTLARTLRLEEILPLLIELLAELIRFDAVGIYLYHSASGMLEWFHGHGYPAGAEEQVRLKVGQGAVGWCAENRMALIIPDVRAAEHYLEARPQTRSEMIVPLLAGEELVGAFNLESDELDGFSQRDLRLLTHFGSQAAIAIQRARLHDQAIEKRRLEEEIGIARRIQRRLLPAEAPRLPGYDIMAFNIPSLEVSGDLYDFVEIVDRQWGIAIGDVAGKGIAAGMIMATFRASLRAEIRNNYSIRTILTKVNRLLWESIEQTAFVTAVYGVLDVAERRLTYANAGHNPPLLVRADGEQIWLREGGTILGTFPSAVYREASLWLQRGDRLVFYTDGITEALAPDGEMFGEERLAGICRERLGAESAQQFCGRLLEAVREHCRGVHAEDDLTAVVLQVATEHAESD